MPAERYVIAEWKTVRANIDYHVEIDRHYYSVPYQLAGQQLEARYTATTVEIFQGGKRVASHARSFGGLPAHDRSRAHAQEPPGASGVDAVTADPLGRNGGEATAEVIRTILESKPHPEMGYRACLGILRLAQDLLQGAARSRQPARAAAACLLVFQSLSSILKRSLDRQPTLELEPASPARGMRTCAAPATTIRPPTLVQ